MPREISDDEYAYLQQRRATADFVESIYNDPALNKEAKRLIKKKYPNLAIPDLDIEDKVTTLITSDKTAREDAEKKKKQEAEDAKWRAERARVQKSYGFTDDAMKKLEDLMQEKSIGDYEVAAEYMAAREPKVSEPYNDSHFWRHREQPGVADIAKDPEGWARKELIGAMQRDQVAARQQR